MTVIVYEVSSDGSSREPVAWGSHARETFQLAFGNYGIVSNNEEVNEVFKHADEVTKTLYVFVNGDRIIGNSTIELLLEEMGIA